MEVRQMLTLKDWLEAQPKIRTIDALDAIWRGWCQDEKCPNNPWYFKPGTKIKIKLPSDHWSKLGGSYD